MLNKSSLLAGAMVLAITMATSPAIAQSTDVPSTSFEPHPILLAERLDEELTKNRGELLEKLNLSMSQKRQIAAIRNRYSAELNSLTSELKSARNTMMSLAQSSASRSQLESQYRVTSNLSSEFADLKFQQMLDIREVLTVTQRREMSAFIAEKQGERGGWFGDR